MHRIPAMLAELRKPDAPPFYDRAAIEALFILKRRQSIATMKQIDRYTAGKAFIIERIKIINFLENHRKKGQTEAERQQRVADSLAGFRNEAPSHPTIPIPILGVKKEVLKTTIAGLSSDIELIPGRLTISFQDSNELLLKLFELAQAIQNDPRTFAALAPQRPERDETFYV